ncbi:MAG: bifunctional glutamate N-acetyltransferase/amino-acid acetyltransferase ArgJ [Hyphomicrobiaceae bacterium]|nr:MAG: bifunctional glutamate N-acetyltransferase/amino-acid acetyltransferase ArgJ [Hyphomicrobiaceae bacterium]
MAKAAAKPSPFAPSRLPDMPAVAGVRLAACEAGIRYANRTDLMVAVLDAGTVAAGVLTRSKTCSAPVLWCRDSLKHGQARALVVNSGNANAFTGRKGSEAARITAQAAAAAVGCAPNEVYLASTGVIGEPLDAGKFVHLLGGLAAAVRPDAFEIAARAIMTTDTYPKLATRTAEIGGIPVVLNGFCKGAGMIAPDMATMLCFIFTDAAIAQPALQSLLSTHVATTFNCMTVDGDTSTSDTCLLFATGAAAGRGQPPVTDAADPRLAGFGAALHDLMRDLAIQIARDGEGLSKFVTVEITGAESWAAARRIALACANSPILKAAIFGEDPNWGRVVMAIGKSGEAADRDRLSIWFGPHIVAREGQRAAEYVEETVAAYMRGREIVIRADVGVGTGQATVWTCDLTHDYISINADYRS